MTWRPTKYLLAGELDNSKPGRVTGWLRFAGLKETVTVHLEGDFNRDIRGAKIILAGRYTGTALEAEDAMEGFAERQTGVVGHITAGLSPQAYTPYPYLEWISDSNDRVVLMPEAKQVTVVNTVTASAGPDRKGERSTTAPRMQLLTKELLRQLPALNAQDGKGGATVAYAKFFTPDAGWTWYAAEFDNEDTFFGLVCGFEKELGYFSLSELESVRGPLGLAIERDLHWKRKPLADIAPELFCAAVKERSVRL
jgi:hypothetical protein